MLMNEAGNDSAFKIVKMLVVSSCTCYYKKDSMTIKMKIKETPKANYL